MKRQSAIQMVKIVCCGLNKKIVVMHTALAIHIDIDRNCQSSAPIVIPADKLHPTVRSMLHMLH